MCLYYHLGGGDRRGLAETVRVSHGGGGGVSVGRVEYERRRHFSKMGGGAVHGSNSQ